MLYVLGSGIYDDQAVEYLVEGPAGADLRALQIEWAVGSDVAPADLESSGFVLWLTADGSGFSLVSYEPYCLTREYSSQLVGSPELGSLWGEPPDAGMGCDQLVGTPMAGQKVACTPFGSRHHLEQDMQNGVRVWRCAWCDRVWPIG